MATPSLIPWARLRMRPERLASTIIRGRDKGGVAVLQAFAQCYAWVFERLCRSGCASTNGKDVIIMILVVKGWVMAMAR